MNNVVNLSVSLNNDVNLPTSIFDNDNVELNNPSFEKLVVEDAQEVNRLDFIAHVNFEDFLSEI
jgi:hypothetical protein